MMLDGLNDQRDAYAQIRALKIGNDVPPAYVFHPGLAAVEFRTPDGALPAADRGNVLNLAAPGHIEEPRLRDG